MCVHMVHTWCATHGAHHVCTTWCTPHMCTMCVPCDMVHTRCTCVLTIITASPVPLAMVLLGHRRALRTPGVAMVMASWPLHGRCVDLVEAVKHVYFSMIKDVLHIMFTLVRKRKDSSF